MVAKRIGTFWKVGELVSLFVQMGCECREAETTVESPDGDCFNLRYLLNPDNGNHVPLLDLSDDHAVSKWEVESWERRLDVTIPKPPG